MTDQHPLTDEKLFKQFWDYTCDADLMGYVLYTPDGMRSAADWQLSQIKEEVKRNLMLWREAGYDYAADACEDFFEEIMPAMRPTTQEDN